MSKSTTPGDSKVMYDSGAFYEVCSSQRKLTSLQSTRGRLPPACTNNTADQLIGHGPGQGNITLANITCLITRATRVIRSGCTNNTVNRLIEPDPMQSNITLINITFFPTVTSTKVPKFSGVTSWDQYRQVFDAIVRLNGLDDTTVALQLLSHLEGNSWNVALLVPEVKRATRAGLVGGTNQTLRITGPVGGLSTPV